jgi:hypothetical protein
MTASATTIQVMMVLFAATLVRAALGFGEALVAVPLLALIIPIQVAAPVAVLNLDHGGGCDARAGLAILASAQRDLAHPVHRHRNAARTAVAHPGTD